MRANIVCMILSICYSYILFTPHSPLSLTLQPLTLHPLTSDTTANQVSPTSLLHPQESPLEGEEEERRVGVLGKGLGKSLSTSTGRASWVTPDQLWYQRCRGGGLGGEGSEEVVRVA